MCKKILVVKIKNGNAKNTVWWNIRIKNGLKNAHKSVKELVKNTNG